MIDGYKHIGLITKFGTNECIDRLDAQYNQQIGTYPCHDGGFSQAIVYQRNQQLVFHHGEVDL